MVKLEMKGDWRMIQACSVKGDDVCGTLARDLRCLLQLAIYGSVLVFLLLIVSEMNITQSCLSSSQHFAASLHRNQNPISQKRSKFIEKGVSDFFRFC
ncbi:hypothetical protein MRB53_011311 [Persea americana]|uniref:Uncharacterized protein n=1 Tax=Persea americana TaxID=3435 RepID=A0ACC2LUE6_PERAE|nr:hypothetical protein MRB53_011311 [Persea americana]